MTLSDDEFRAVAEFAAVQLEPEPMASEAYVAKIYTTLSGNLKMRRFEDDREADLNVAVFVKALAGHMTRGQLEFAVGRAIREREWMPNPGQLLKLTQGYERADYGPKKAARKLVAERSARQRREIYRTLVAQEHPEGRLSEIPDWIVDKALEQHVLFRDLDGILKYPTAENLQADGKARREFTRSLRRPEAQA